MTADALRRSEVSSASLNNDLEDDYDFEEEEDAASNSSHHHHPFLSRRSLSKASFEASHAFVNAMIIQSSEDDTSAQPNADSALSDIGTPRSILMSRKLGQAHADALLPQLSPRMPVISPAVDLHSMPHLTLDDDTPTQCHASTLTVDEDDDEVVSRRLEREIRKMMVRTHLNGDSAEELEGMSEGPQELQRIGEALSRCMMLRTKYMQISMQRESDNPRNQAQWQIYPAPPPPAWRNFDQPVKEAAQEFDLAKCEIPGDDGCTFAMGDDGVYAVFDKDSSVPFTMAPSIREFYMDLDFLLDTISDGPVKTWAYRRLRYLDARWQL
ncbi:AMP deaminase, partial [Coemansia pectinata]